MVDVIMSPMPPKVIGRDVCLWAKGHFVLSKDPRPKRHLSILWKKESKEISDFMKVKDGSVHHKRYNGCCTKQWVRIPKATWTTTILGKRFTYRASFCRISLMKDDVKVTMPNGTPKILIPLDGVLKFGGKSKRDRATHFWGWMERPIAQSSFGSVYK
jgi:hypothetical protein